MFFRGDSMKLVFKKVIVLLAMLFMLFLSVSMVSAIEDTNSSLNTSYEDLSLEEDNLNLEIENNLMHENESEFLNNNSDYTIFNKTDINESNHVNLIGDGEIFNKNIFPSSKASLITNGVSKEISSNLVVYKGFESTFKVVFEAEGVKLTGREVNITIDDLTYTKTTNYNGEIIFNLPDELGKHTIKYSLMGGLNIQNLTGFLNFTVIPSLKTNIKIADSNINYRQGLKSAFIVKLVDGNNKALKNKTVVFKVNGKTYTAKTDSKGYATIKINLKKGSYVIKFLFEGDIPYFSSQGSYKIKVKSPMAKGYSYWVNGKHMKRVKLSKLAKLGTKHIFLLANAFSIYGKSSVVSWIKQANKKGIKVHIWMQVFYNGGKWVRTVDANGKYKYSFFNKKIKEAKYYARVKGVAGVHFDYLRYPGGAYKYSNSVSSITYFTKKCGIEVHKVKPNAIMSAAVMPEPGAMIKYYGQDIPQLSKYLDVVVPMSYKGNYRQNTKWIKSVTSTFVKQSNGAQIWAGLQTYKSDSNPKKLSYQTLFKDAKSGMNGGAKGIVLFRYGLTKFINFKKL